MKEREKGHELTVSARSVLSLALRYLVIERYSLLLPTINGRRYPEVPPLIISSLETMQSKWINRITL